MSSHCNLNSTNARRITYCDALISKNVPKSSSSSVTGFSNTVKWVGERMDLELKSDFEHIEWSYAESELNSAKPI